MKKHYEFKGVILLFNNIIAYNYQTQTFAISKQKAISNISFRAKEKFGLLPSSKIKLDGILKELKE